MPRLMWGGEDVFTHTIIVGPTRCGKTSTLIKPLIYQILMAKARGYKCGLSVVEPKGDVAKFTVELARELGMKAYHLDPTLEAPEESDRVNLMKGPADDVAEATVAVLKSMFGKQEAFFQTVQELTARNFIKLLKINHGDNLDMISVLRALRDEEILKKETLLLERSGADPDLHSFFVHEMKGRTGDKWREFSLGLRAQLENLFSNNHLSPIINGDTGLNLDRHMAEGGILGVNTALGKLRRSGDAFGQFITMHLQSAAFRRPGTERTRIPHYLIIDEMSRYINPDTERFLSIAAEYRVAGIFALQSFTQLEISTGDLSGKSIRTAILTNCRNKISFGGLSNEDAEYFAKELGKDWEMRRENTYAGDVLADFFPKTYRDTETENYRIRPTDIQDGLPRFHFIHKLTREGHPCKPGIAVGAFVPDDWRERARELTKKQEASKSRGFFSFWKKNKETPPEMGLVRADTVPERDVPEQAQTIRPAPEPPQTNDHSNSLTNDHSKQQAEKPEPIRQQAKTGSKSQTPTSPSAQGSKKKIIVNQKIKTENDKKAEELKRLNDNFI